MKIAELVSMKKFKTVKLLQTDTIKCTSNDALYVDKKLLLS